MGFVDSSCSTAQYFESVKVLESLNSEDSASVRKANELFEDLEVKNGLVFISRHFSHLPGAITRLEKKWRTP